MRLVRWLSVVLGVAWLGPVAAQSIDCTKARLPVERAVCASPHVLLQDQLLAQAYSAALARTPEHATELRAAQGQWQRERNASCAKFGNPRAVEACLTQAYAQRLAALSPPSTTPAAAAPRPTQTAAAPEVLSVPAAPAVAIAQAAASLEQTKLPAAEQMQTRLRVTAPGRFAIRAQSITGTALQLIDMLTGPTDTMGQAGQTDGRLDALLDIGTYKLRAFAAAGATGEVSLSVTPFGDAGPATGAPVRGQLDAELSDIQQRRFWLSVADGEALRIEAAGRALGDLVLWRNGRDLVSVSVTRRAIEPGAGHPLTDIVLTGQVEPGVYELVAYGAKPLVWADGSAAMPFHLRTGASEALSTGWVSGKIGAFGSEIFRTGLAASALRLDLPEAANAELFVSGAEGQRSATIARNQREPTARLSLPAEASGPHLVELRGAEGQPFDLRALSGVVTNRVMRNGTYWFSADSFGLGGDEAPAAYVFLRRPTNGPFEVLGSVLPKIAPGTAWRAKFNLRGPMTLPFEVTAGGPIGVRTDGVTVQADIAPFGAAFQPRANGATPGQWDLAAGLYVLRLQPPANAAGILDITLGPPGVTVTTATAPAPADPAWPIGLTTLAGNGQLELLATNAPPFFSGLLARPAPVDLAAGPLAITLRAGEGEDVPVRLPLQGTLAATEFGVGPVPVTFESVAGPTAGRIGIARVSAADHIRTVALSWQRPLVAPLPVPAPPSLPAMQPLAAATPFFFDLNEGGLRNFALEVPAGGLYRVETIGRLRTSGTIGTGFIPDLAHQAANGAGQNMLIQRFLRAGAYRLQVGAKDSSGHLGVQARPAAVQAGAPLDAEGSVRALMAEDEGEIFPIEITRPGTYRLNLLSLADGLTGRLEDAEGWPLRPAGDLSDITQDLAPGQYRLLVQPAGVAARVVARLQSVLPVAPTREGHGPFPLDFEAPARAIWREPPGRDDPRLPDRWEFSLAGSAEVKLTIDDGMEAKLTDGKVTLARFTHAAPFAGRLPAGPFGVLASSQGRNDRLDYSLRLSSTELQPKTSRQITLPATIPFAIDAERVVNLTSFGHVPLRATLRRADGSLVERLGDRGDDWNIGLSRRLPAGAYRLTLQAAIPPKGEAVHPSDAGGFSDRAAEPADKDDEEPADGAINEPAAPPDQPAPAETAAASDGSDDANPTPSVELRLSLPADRPVVTASASGTLELENGGVHVVALPDTPDRALILAVASSAAEVAVSLERRGSDGAWRSQSTHQGTAPVVGGVGEGDTSWRALIWAVDGGTASIRFATRVLSGEPQPPGAMAITQVPLEGMPQTLAAVPVAVPGSRPLSIGGATDIWVASAGRALAAPDGPVILPQNERIWLLAQRDQPVLTVTALTGLTGPLALPRDGQAWLPSAATKDGYLQFWLAESGLGQPGLDAGRGMGVAAGSALALSGAERLRVFNAGGSDPLRLRLKPFELAEQPETSWDGSFARSLPPASALQLTLPPGMHRADITLAPGTAAITGWRDAGAVTIWTGSDAVARSVTGSFTDVLLVNTNAQSAPVSLALAGDDPMTTLAPGTAFKRFYGAAGSIDLTTGDTGRLLVAGGEATLIDQTGRVSRGRDLPLNGAGRVTIAHGAGLLAAWVEQGDHLPWSKATPQTVTLPQRLAMHDPSMALDFSTPDQMLLHVRSSAPVILRLGEGPPMLFAQGAELHRAVPAGPTRLSVISPHDGPLSGTLDIAAEPIAPASEGIGAEVAVAPGAAAAFGFTVVRSGPVGVGVRAEPDQVDVRLLSEAGALVGVGVAQLQNLRPGRYVLEAQIPPDAVTTVMRPAIVGIAPHPNGPPPDVVKQYLALAGHVPTHP
jgi:uncharacterized protein